MRTPKSHRAIFRFNDAPATRIDFNYLPLRVAQIEIQFIALTRDSNESLALLALEVCERGQHVDSSAQRLRIGARVLLLEVRLQKPPFEAARADGVRLAMTAHIEGRVAVLTVVKQGRSLADGDQRISLG
jgi:hypothetical protein